MYADVMTRHELEAKIEGAGSRQIALPASPVNAADLSEADLEKMAGAGGGLAVATVSVALLVSFSVAHSVNEYAGW
jgi:hypothetical protein